LGHGGGDHINAKPNYLSVMNYGLTLPVADPTRRLDYSDQSLPTLNEIGLNEPSGLGLPLLDAPPRYTVFANPRTRQPVVTRADGPIDWNADDMLAPAVVADINSYRVIVRHSDGREAELFSFPPGFEILKGFNDWANVTNQFRRVRYVGLPAPLSDDDALPVAPGELPDPEPTLEGLLALAEAVDFDGDGLVNARDNCPAIFNPDQADADRNGLGDACEAVPGQADLVVTKLARPPQPVLGNALIFAITVSNRGPDTAVSVVLEENLPPDAQFWSARSSVGTCGFALGRAVCNLGNLAPNASAELEVVVAPGSTELFISTARASSSTADPDPTNNEAPFQSAVLDAPTLRARVEGAEVTVSWPVAFEGFALERTEGLAAPVQWSPVATKPQIRGDQNTVVLTPEGRAGFYRLRKP
jgi:uncharacterized repeat protein (TIGR01451 family)